MRARSLDRERDQGRHNAPPGAVWPPQAPYSGPQDQPLMLRDSIMTTTFNRSLAFALGFGFAFLPSYGPLVGLLLLFASRLALRRSDLLWAGAALLLALPLAIHQGLSGLLFGLAQVLAPWLIYKTFSRLPGSELGNNARLLGIGLVSGLAAVVILGLWQLGMHGAPGEGPFAQAITWNADPALYGHTVLALGVLLAVLVPGAWLRLASLGLSAVGIAASGSREAAFAWLLVAGILALSGLGRSWRPKLVHLTLLGGMLLLLLVPGTMRLRAAGASLPTAASTALSPRAQAQTDELKPASEPVPTWQAAWRTFTQRPLLGWG
ncbi:MAG TPA: hypothetical protein VF171_00420, partial [Trueperaceae bacterium]